MVVSPIYTFSVLLKKKYNKETTTAPTLNDFICKMFLWYENPNPTFINPLTAYNQIKYNKYLEYRTKQRKLIKTKNNCKKVNNIILLSNNFEF